jgi:hypothetical protein
MAFVHHVFFWLKAPNNQSDRAELIKGLETLTSIGTIQKYHIGAPAPTHRSVVERTYSVSWLCFFEDVNAEESYQNDPIHLDFVENHKHLWEKVVVYDSI